MKEFKVLTFTCLAQKYSNFIMLWYKVQRIFKTKKQHLYFIFMLVLALYHNYKVSPAIVLFLNSFIP